MSVLDGAYWDQIAEARAQVSGGFPTGAELYTQASAVNAFLLGLEALPLIYGHVRVLKTDLWSEGLQRSREVLMNAMVAAQGWNIEPYAIDISPGIVDRARKYLPNVQVASIVSLPFAGEFFDLILDCSTIDHVSFRDAAEKALREYSRCLASRGVLVLQYAPAGGTLDKKPKTDYYCFKPSEVAGALAVAGFKVVGQYSCQHLNTWPLALFGALRAYSLFNWLEYSPVSRFFYRLAPMYTVIARKE